MACLVAQQLLAGTQQSITFNALAEKLTTDVPFVLSGTASSNLPVSFSIVSPAGVATLSASTVTLSGSPGSVTIKASQSGNGTYDPAPEVYRTFTVRRGGFTIIAQGATAAHRLAIKSDGTLWGWGNNSVGEVGNNSTTDVMSPVQITSATDWTAIAVGGEFSAGVRNGTLWTWGRNSSGQLGQGDFTNRFTPVQVGTESNWASVSAGTTFMIARRTNGTLWAWGSNASGQLGQGDTTTRNAPVQIGTGTAWMAAEAGSDHVIALQNNAGSISLWSWGLNSSGQLGDGTTTLRSAPAQVGSVTTWAKIACGSTSSYAIRSNGTLWSWGGNTSGQLGLGNSVNQLSPLQVGALITWAEVGGGNIQAFARQTDGSLWSMGGTGNVGSTATLNGSTFPLRVGTDVDWSTVAAGTSYSMAIKSNGTLWSAGAHQNGRLGYPMPNLRPMISGGIRAISMSLNSTHLIKTDGTMWAVGSAGSGIFGDGTTANRTQLQQVGTGTNWQSISGGNNHILAQRTDGTLWATGIGSSGQLGDGSALSRSTFVQVGSTSWSSFSAGANHSLALRNDGTLWAWGSNTNGELGDGSNTQRNSPVQIGSDSDWAQIFCGSSSSYAIKTNGTLWSWGSNSSGQLGDGSTTSRNTPAQVGSATTWFMISGGLSHTMGVRTDGTLWGWGSNSFGNIGDGSFTQRTSPVQIGSGTTWLKVQCTSQHSMALRNDGTLWVCGLNSSSQLGTGDSANRNVLVQLGGHNLWSMIGSGRGLLTIAATADGTLWGTGNNSTYSITSAQRVWSSMEPVHAALSTQTLSFPAVSITAYNTPVTLSATASSGLPVSYFVMGPATLSGNQLTATGPGEIKVLAYQGGDRPSWHDTAPLQASVSVLPYLYSASATGVTSSTATLNASANAEGQTTSCLFEYDTNISDGSYAFNLTSSPTSFAGYSSTAVSATATGLASGTVYYYRVTASNATGSSSVTGTFTTPLSAFDVWAAGNSLSGLNATLAADGDFDGMTNLLEWACALNPGAPDALNSSTTRSLTGLEFNYARSVAAVNAGALFIVEFSDNLQSNSWSAAGVTQSVISDNGTVQQVKASVPDGSATTRFIRLRVVSP